MLVPPQNIYSPLQLPNSLLNVWLFVCRRLNSAESQRPKSLAACLAGCWDQMAVWQTLCTRGGGSVNIGLVQSWS